MRIFDLVKDGFSDRVRNPIFSCLLDDCLLCVLSKDCGVDRSGPEVKTGDEIERAKREVQVPKIVTRVGKLKSPAISKSCGVRPTEMMVDPIHEFAVFALLGSLDQKTADRDNATDRFFLVRFDLVADQLQHLIFVLHGKMSLKAMDHSKSFTAFGLSCRFRGSTMTMSRGAM